jgi:hypothetical protein
MKRRSPYTGYRRDGWPLCPSCGEDELYSLAWDSDGPKPSLKEFIDTIRGCYRCAWYPE